jgi:hypothetical protein
MGLLIVTSVAFFGLLLWLMDGWMTGHALVASKNGKWEIVSQGWWMLLSLGGPLGAFAFLIGLISNIPAWSRLLGFLEEKQDAEIEQTRASLVDKRLKLEARETAMDRMLQQAAAEGRKDGDRIAQEATEALKKAESLVRGYEKRLFDLTGRLKGAQQKATRFKQKALLMTGETQKPNEAV